MNFLQRVGLAIMLATIGIGVIGMAEPDEISASVLRVILWAGAILIMVSWKGTKED